MPQYFVLVQRWAFLKLLWSSPSHEHIVFLPSTEGACFTMTISFYWFESQVRLTAVCSDSCAQSRRIAFHCSCTQTTSQRNKGYSQCWRFTSPITDVVYALRQISQGIYIFLLVTFRLSFAPAFVYKLVYYMYCMFWRWKCCQQSWIMQGIN